MRSQSAAVPDCRSLTTVVVLEIFVPGGNTCLFYVLLPVSVVFLVL